MIIAPQEKKRVVFLELPVFSGVVPLASGYMEAYCRHDPDLARAFTFEKISTVVTTPYRDTLSTLYEKHASVYAFSCYVWNSKLVSRLLAALVAAEPDATFILGGPQVMHQGLRYLSPQHENVYICNGEGEITFAAFLREWLSPDRDFSRVRNLSFYRSGTLITTEPEPRISDLSQIPSPFLEGVFEVNTYSWMLLETNRGCPFKCNYCYWGAATGARLYKYGEERLRQELEWISQSKCWYLFIADANWGILKRDVDLSRYIVDCQKRYGSPMSVYFCGAKNSPDRVAEITGIFHDAGIISTQSVALQTMSTDALVRVNRDNIKTAAYGQIQRSLNDLGIASFVEMIWPLPGETLASFQDGMAELCRMGADSFVIYPLLLMNNVDLATKRAEYGLVTVPDPDPNSEAEIVTETAQVTLHDYREGLRFAYAVLSLYAFRGLWWLGRYLDANKILSYRELFARFVQFCKERPDDPWTMFCEKSIRHFGHTTFSNTGALVHLILHSNREAFDALLGRFVESQPFWGDPLAELYFEMDLIHRPFVYRNSAISPKRHPFARLQVLSVLPNGYLIEVPSESAPYLREQLRLPDAGRPANRFEVIHRKSQMPHMPSKSLHEHYMYCQDMSQRMTTLLADWRPHA